MILQVEPSSTNNVIAFLVEVIQKEHIFITYQI